jgi:hypothetical protein
MKEHKERNTNPKSKSILLVALLGAATLVMSAPEAFAQYDHTITPDQFNFQTWGGNLFTDTAGAYAGDNATGYYWTPDMTASASATIIIPLPAGLQSGWHQYNVYEWIPTAHSSQWHVLDIAADGTMNNNPTMPWAGQFGTDHQYISVGQDTAPGGAWLKLGPGPQTDSSNDGGQGVWINPTTGNGAPYLQMHLLASWETGPQSFDAIRLVQIDVVPEPSTLALGLIGGFALLAGIRRAKH